MKNFIGLLALFCLSFISPAQTNKVYNFTGVTFGATKDSIIATGSGGGAVLRGADTLQIHSQASAGTVSIQYVATKVSGTVNSQAKLYASIDGKNWIVPFALSSDTLHVANQTTTTTVWTLLDNPFSYYRIITDTVASLASTAQKFYTSAKFLPNKQGGLVVGTYNFLSGTVPANKTDTVTNTATNSVSLQVQSWYNTLTVQANLVKISGTQAGTLTLQGSIDGINYVTVPTAYIKSATFTPGVYGGSATATATNVASQSFAWVISQSPFEFYRVSWAGSGTMSSSLAAVLLPSK